MASGLPVVAVLAGGVKENLLNRYNGLAAENNDVAEFSSKLEELIINDRLRDSLAHNARKYALEKSWDHIFEKMHRSYQKVIADYTSVYGRVCAEDTSKKNIV